MTDKPEPQTTVMFSKTDWDDLHAMVQVYKIRMSHMLDSDFEFEDDSDSREIIERRIHLAERIIRASKKS